MIEIVFTYIQKENVVAGFYERLLNKSLKLDCHHQFICMRKIATTIYIYIFVCGRTIVTQVEAVLFVLFSVTLYSSRVSSISRKGDFSKVIRKKSSKMASWETRPCIPPEWVRRTPAWLLFCSRSKIYIIASFYAASEKPVETSMGRAERSSIGFKFQDFENALKCLRKLFIRILKLIEKLSAVFSVMYLLSMSRPGKC